MELLQLVYFGCMCENLILTKVAEHVGISNSYLNRVLKTAGVIKNNTVNHKAKWEWLYDKKPDEELVDRVMDSFRICAKGLKERLNKKETDFSSEALKLIKENNELLKKLTAQEQIALKY